ncbi:hypothetical protein PMSD_17060 [Paenibacillus macquariensis subsp. defensor]|nr:hypothetical protein PMSD_17060 [Paenibacillus macquariensis subsp. defensor]
MKDVYEEFSELIKSEQVALFNAMKQDLFPIKYIELMVEGYTLPKIAEHLEIHISLPIEKPRSEEKKGFTIYTR